MPLTFEIKTSVWKFSGDLKSRYVLILNGQKEVSLQMVRISNGIWNPEAQPFEIWTNYRDNLFTYDQPTSKSKPH